MPSPVCVQCAVEFRCDKNGVPYVEMSDGHPYKVWDSDRWRCPSCGTTILSGFGMRPYLERHEDGFQERYTKVVKDPNVVVEKERT